MNDEEFGNLLAGRAEELISSIPKLQLCYNELDDCYLKAREICGVSLIHYENSLRVLANYLYACGTGGTMTLDDAVTHLNNLPLGLRIAELQRAEVLEAEPELMPEEVEQGEKSLEQLCDEYEAVLVEGKHAPEAVAYIMALEDLVSELQGKSFTDSSMIGQLEAENAALKVRLNGECSYSKFFSYKETEAFNDLHDEFFKNVSEKLFSDEEKLLIKLIEKHIHDWDGSIESLIGRLDIISRLRDVSKTVVIDGKPVAVIYGPSYQVQGSKYLGLIQYKELNES